MPSWKKVITSGSNAVLHNITSSGDFEISGNISGSSTSTGSFGNVHVASKLAIQNTTPRGPIDVLGSHGSMGFYLSDLGTAVYLPSDIAHSGGGSGFDIQARNYRLGTNGGGPVSIYPRFDAQLNLGTTDDTDLLVLSGSTKISGSSISTGSFADGRFVGKVAIGTTSSPTTDLAIGGASYTGGGLYVAAGSSNRVALLGNIEVTTGTGGSWSGQSINAQGSNRTLSFKAGGNLNASDSSTFLFTGTQGNARTVDQNTFEIVGGYGNATLKADYSFMKIGGTVNQTNAAQSGSVIGIEYDPSFTLAPTGSHTAFLATSGDIVSRGTNAVISGSSTSTGSFGRIQATTIAGNSPLNIVSPTLVGDTTVQGNITATGDVIAQNYIVSSSTTYMTTSFSAGSTAFGDTQDDNHDFTGSVNITGSVFIEPNDGDITTSGKASLWLKGPNSGIKIQRHDSTNGYTHIYTDVASTDYLYLRAGNTTAGGIAVDRIGDANVNPSNNSIQFGDGEYIKTFRRLGKTQLTMNDDITFTLDYNDSFIVSGSEIQFTPTEKVNVTGNIEASGNISGSVTSTGSFGHVKIPDGNIDIMRGNAATRVGIGKLNTNNFYIGANPSGSAASGGNISVRVGTVDSGGNVRSDWVFGADRSFKSVNQNVGDITMGGTTFKMDSTYNDVKIQMGYDTVPFVLNKPIYNLADVEFIQDEKKNIKFFEDAQTGGEIMQLYRGGINVSGSGNISGSSTSTGSFGRGYIDTKLGIGGTNDGLIHKLIVNGQIGGPTFSGTYINPTGGNLVLGANNFVQSNNSIIPTYDYTTVNARDLGSTTYRWNDIHFGGDISGSSTSTGSFGKLLGDGSQLTGISTGGLGNIVEDTTPQLGGDLDLNSNDITGTGNISITGGLTLAGGSPNINGSGGSVYMIPTNFIVRSNIVNDSGDVKVNDNLTVTGNVSGSSTSTGSFGSGRIAGKLGIQTTTPRGPIDVKGSNGSQGFYVSDTGLKAYLPTDIAHSAGAGTFDLQVESLRLGRNGYSAVTVYPRFNSMLQLGTQDDTNLLTLSGSTKISGSLTSTGSFGDIRVVNKLGINKDVPLYPLHVEGSAVIEDGYRLFVDRVQAWSGQLKLHGDNTNSMIQIRNNATIQMTGSIDTSGSFNVANGNITTTGNISGSSTSTGSFGRGFIADTLRLNSTDTSTTEMVIKSSDTDHAIFLIEATDGIQGLRVDESSGGDVNLTMRDTSGNADIVFHPGTNSYFNNNGNFGIGTSSPTLGKLQVNTSGNTRGLHINATDSNASYMQLSNSSTGTATNAGLQVGLQTDESAFVSVQHNAHLQFNTYSTERIRIHAGGTVEFKGVNQVISGSSSSTGSFGQGHVANLLGVGTLSPSSTLHVVGGIRTQSANNSISFFLANNTTRLMEFKNMGDNSTILKTSGAYNLRFGTNDVDRLMIQQGTGNVGIGTTSPDSKLHVVGDIRATGDIIAENYIVSSSVTHMTQSFSSGSTIFGDTITDTHKFTGSLSVSGSVDVVGNLEIDGALTEASTMRIKTNIETLESPLDKITKLRGVSYNLRKSNEPSIGMIAEEVEEVFPELVSKDDSGKASAMSYGRMTAVLLEAIKELKQEVDELRQENIYIKDMNRKNK